MRFLAVALTVILRLQIKAQWGKDKETAPLFAAAIYEIALTKRPKLGIPYMNYW